MQNVSTKSQELLKFLQIDYINHGYMYSGSWPYASLRERGYGKEHMKELESAGLIQRRNCDDFAYELTPAERAKLIEEYDLQHRWKSCTGKGLFDSIDHEISSVRSEAAPQAEPPKPSLADQIRSAELRSSGKVAENYFFLTAHPDRTWSMALSGAPADGSSIPFVKEQSYPVQLCYRRTDMNGSGVVDAVDCKSREDLLSTLNWMGKAGFVPLDIWDFHMEAVQNEPLLETFHAGESRRLEMVQKEIDLMLGTMDDEPGISATPEAEPER